MVEEMLEHAIKRSRGVHQFVVAYVALAGSGNYFGGVVEVEVKPPCSEPFSAAVTLACRKLAETIAPKNVGQVFSATGALRVHRVSTGKEEIFAGDSV